MIFKTPSFWYKNAGWQVLLLSPLSALYYIAHKINLLFQKPYKASIPVICVGNVIMGGSGKTPSVIALLKLIKNNNLAQNPIVLTRGYGGTITQPTIIDLHKNTYKEVGDEALLLAKHATVIISPNRQLGAKKAEEFGADLILMDDGFQNNKLHKDISLLVVDGNNPFGNGYVFPAGPLRESTSPALKRCDAIITINGSTTLKATQFNSVIKPNTDTIDLNKKYLAFAGLGRPEKFKTTLEELKLNIIKWQAFADHYPYTKQDLEKLDAAAVKNNAELITTEKDHVRLPEPYQHTVHTLPIDLSFNNKDNLVTFLKDKLKSC